MTKTEKLEKLRGIKPTAFPTVMTYDMGLQFDTYTSKGIGNHLGEISSWPLWKIKRLSQDSLETIQEKINKKSLTPEDFRNTGFYQLASELLKNKNADLNTVFENIKNFPATEDSKYLYVFADTESAFLEEVLFFGTENEITQEFFERFPVFTSWEDLEESELDDCLEELRERGEGLVFNEFDGETES